MILPAQVRKFLLTTHIIFSVGWLGAVIAVLVPAIAVVASLDVQVVRGGYLMMDLATWWLLIPLSLASLLTGIVQGLGTRWRLLEHYWVLAKLVMNAFATLVLLLYTRVIGTLADIAAQPSWSSQDRMLLEEPNALLHSAGAIVLLLIATVLSVYKPRGLTGYGRRKQRAHASRAGAAAPAG